MDDKTKVEVIKQILIDAYDNGNQSGAYLRGIIDSIYAVACMEKDEA